MNNQEKIHSAKQHFAEAKSQKKPKQAKKQKAIILEKQKMKSPVDLHVDDLRYKITDSNEESKDQQDLPAGYISVNAKALHKLLDCHLCKGIPRKVKTIKCCLQRFCCECIDQWLKLGNKVCPACLASCPSQEDIAEDHNIDRLAAICFPQREEHEIQDEDMQPMDQKSVQQDKGKKPECGVTSNIPHSSSMSQSIPADDDDEPEAPFFPSDEMLERVAKRVGAAIIQHKRKLATQQPPPIDLNKKQS